ncbi:MAG TPA: asparaginase [Streptosporangiaceae bacterium]|nr:asparaginase [Streptosporangiaceae bacterium]
MTGQPANPVLAEVVRSGFTESWHRGSLVVLGADGSAILGLGATDVPIFPRSSNKPMQATAMLECGLDLPDDRLVALAAASHSGEKFHVDGVRDILRRAGLSEADLQCPPDWPLDDAARNDLIRAGGERDRIHMNCSGKHSAMLAASVASGWPARTYRDPEHPLQQRIKATIESLAGERVTAIGVDGCGAPLMALTLRGLASGFSAIVRSKAGSAARRVADAMRSYPEWMSGTRRYEAALMRAVPGMLMKPGADGVCAFALADGRSGAIKMDDGAQRAVSPVAAALLRQLVTHDDGGPDGGRVPDLHALDELANAPVFGGGEPVGNIRPILPSALSG